MDIRHQRAAHARKCSIKSIVGDSLLGKYEIRPLPTRSVVIGQFTSARSVLSASGRSIYTEVKIHVTDVFEDISGRIFPNSDITMGFLGGTVTTAARKTISLFTHPRLHSVQPGRTYLLNLIYEAAPEFYVMDESWDLTSGTVSSNSNLGDGLAADGASALQGLTKAQLAAYLTDELKKQKQQ